MKKVVIMLLIVFSWVSVAAASPITDAIDELNASGKQSNAFVNHSIIDLVYISQGSITSYTYIGEAEELTVKNFSVQSQTYGSATNKITSFVFELTNRYRPDTDLALSVNQPNEYTVHVYTYGTMKNEAMWAVILGLPDCLGNPAYHQRDDGGGWVEKYAPENIVQTIATFNLNSTVLMVNDEPIVMDVKPEVKDDRTYVPVRYLAYALGVTEDGITWDGTTQTVGITKGETGIELTIGSKIAKVNNEPVEMDVAPYATQGRTMLPARWVAEPLGAKVEWGEEKVMIKFEEQG